MEFHHLRYITEVAKQLNFSKAAVALCISQPTLSQQILKLEQEIGFSIFERKTRSVRLTSAGQEFVRGAEKVLNELVNLQQLVQNHQFLRNGQLRIGTLPLTGSHSFINVLSAFQNNYPGILIKIIEAAGSYDLVKLLQAGTIDVAYLIPPPHVPAELTQKLLLYPLQPGRLILIMPKNHHLAKKKKLSLADVSQEHFILPPQSHSMYQVAMEACRQHDFKPKIACECGQLNMVFNLVAKGAGISFASSQLLEEAIPANIKLIPLYPAIDRTVCLGMLKNNHQLPLISIFRDFIVAAAKSKEP